MNQQQKTHAISRIFSILTTKASAIVEEDTAQIKIFNETGRVTNEDVLAMLSDRTWFPVPNCVLGQSAAGTTVSNLLDLTPLHEQKKAEQGKLTRPLINGHYGKSVTLV